MRYFIIVVAILALSFGGFYYLKSKNIVHLTPSISKASGPDVPKGTKNTEPSHTKSAKEVSSDPIDQIKEYGEKMKEWTSVVTEMNGVLEDVKSTVQRETVANK